MYKTVRATRSSNGFPLGRREKIQHARLDALRAASNRIKLISAEAENRVHP